MQELISSMHLLHKYLINVLIALLVVFDCSVFCVLGFASLNSVNRNQVF